MTGSYPRLLTELICGQRPEWMLHAACRNVDPELFYPDRGGPATAAKHVCAGCPVKTNCLDYALARGDNHGIYGGLNPWERHQLRVQPSPHAGVKLTAAVVADCRRRHTNGDSQRALAVEHGVSQQTMRAAINGHTWAQVGA